MEWGGGGGVLKVLDWKWGLLCGLQLFYFFVCLDCYIVGFDLIGSYGR